MMDTIVNRCDQLIVDNIGKGFQAADENVGQLFEEINHV